MVLDRGAVLHRGIAVANGKGGTGKTSLAAGLAATAASMGWRCLAIDLDPQGTLAVDLGARQSGRADDGVAALRALTGDGPLVPVQGVREGLDLVTAGPATDWLVEALDGVGPARDVLVEAGRGYDLVVFDTPPAASVLLDLALAASRFVCCPVRFDQASIDGLARVDGRRRVLREAGLNTELELLGLVLFGFAPSERRLLRDTRAQLEHAVDGVAPVFPTFVRESRTAARHMRAHGVVATEYLVAAQEAAPRWDADPGAERFARNTAGLASDYWELTREVLSQLCLRLEDRPLVGVRS
jgi:chromosome partitioning protein